MIKIKVKDILVEGQHHWVHDAGNEYHIYRNEVTHSVRCGIISKKIKSALSRAKDQVIKRDMSVNQGNKF